MRRIHFEESEPRIAVMSVRNIDSHVSRSHSFEFEDAICSMDNVDVFAPAPGPFHKMAIKAKNWASKKTAAAEHLPTGLQSMRMEKDYDVFFVSIASLRDLNLLSSIGNWRKKSKRAVVWIQELWLNDLNKQGLLLEKLNQFDLVVCSFAETTRALQSHLKTEVIYLPWGIDGLRFCPFPDPPKRNIKVLSVGAKNERTHESLLDHFRGTGELYLYDTVSGRPAMQDYQAHRDNFISQIQRSKFFFCYAAKIERIEERGNQVEFGLRYLEALAGGAVVLGERIESEAFKKHFGWPDAVIEVPYESTNIGKTISELSLQKNRLKTISLRNSKECLLRHDHLNRWQKVLDTLGLPHSEQMMDRRSQIADLAHRISAYNGSVHDFPTRKSRALGPKTIAN